MDFFVPFVETKNSDIESFIGRSSMLKALAAGSPLDVLPFTYFGSQVTLMDVVYRAFKNFRNKISTEDFQD